MIPTMQTAFGKGNGNCLSACIASILEIPIDTVPNWAKEKNWQQKVNEWLQKYNLCYLELAKSDHLEFFAQDCGCHYIMNGKSPRGEFWHSVVGRGGKMVHDPHPENRGLEKIETLGFLVHK